MISKKNKRKLTVDGRDYWWQVHYDKDCVRPYIYISSDGHKPLIKESFDKERSISADDIEAIIKANNLEIN